MTSQLKKDWILIILWPIIASIIMIFFKANFFTSILLYYVLPSIVISYRHQAFIIKSLLFAGASLPMLLVVDYMAVKAGSWYFPTSIFAHRLFGVTTFEVVLWMFSYVYFVVIFYEYFLDHACKVERTRYALRYVFIPFLIIFLIFLSSIIFTEIFFKVNYLYLWFGIIFAFIPIPLVLLKFPHLFTKLAEATVYFSFSSFLWEIVALRLNQWTFPGQYFIGWIEIFNVRFPFEEFLIWIVLGAAAILSWYEFFDDDGK